MNKKLNIASEEIMRILSLHENYKLKLFNEQQANQPSVDAPPSPELKKTRNELIQFFTTAKEKGCLTDPNLKYDSPYQLTGKNAYYIKGPSQSMKGMIKRVFSDYTWTIVDPKTGKELKKSTWTCSPLTQVEKPKDVNKPTNTISLEQQGFIDKWEAQGYKYNPTSLEQVNLVSVDVITLGAPPNLFPKGTKLWYDPNKQKDISRKDDSVLDTTLDDQEINRRACKKNIEDFYKAFQTRKSVVVDPAKLEKAKKIVQACKDQHYGKWGVLGGGRKWDNILDLLSGNKSNGPISSSPYRLN